MRYHDFQLTGYDVRDSGSTITLHLALESSQGPRIESHLRFDGVALYHFIHLGRSILTDLAEIGLEPLLQKHWETIQQWAAQHGGLRDFDRDARSSYRRKLEATGLRAWEIESAIGFEGFVVAARLTDVTCEFLTAS